MAHDCSDPRGAWPWCIDVVHSCDPAQLDQQPRPEPRSMARRGLRTVLTRGAFRAHVTRAGGADVNHGALVRIDV